jgi:4-alpha-glucanotransferase
MRDRQYGYVRDYLRFQMRHTGLLRIDHVMGLHRLYWVPHGFSPKQGVYVSYPAEELYALLSLESHRHQTTLVGENLGTVPPQVNGAMKRHGLRQMYVIPFEQQPDPHCALRPVRAASVASLNTHDMPTFAAYWRGLDLADRKDLGLIRPAEVAGEKRQRRRLNTALLKFLRSQNCFSGQQSTATATAAEALQACLQWLARTDAEVVLVTLEDLWLETAPQNTPGTHLERPNWRRKAALSLERVREAPALRKILEELNWRRRVG